MSNRRQKLHLERSIVTVNALRLRKVSLSQFERAMSHGDARPTRSQRLAVRRAWAGLRPLGFDPVGARLSELERIDAAFEGAAYFFFHALWNLIAPPLQSSEKYRLKEASTPDWLINEDRRRSASNDAEEARQAAHRLSVYARRDASLQRTGRARLSAAETAKRHKRDVDLRTVHECILQLHSPLRDLLMEPSSLDTEDVPPAYIPWVRRSPRVEQELEAVVQAAPLIDAVAACLALVLEAGLTGRERDRLRLREALESLLASMARERMFKGAGARLARWIRRYADAVGVRETGLVYAQLAALPESWRRVSISWSEVEPVESQ